MAFRRRELEPPRVELTPMIDVVFLLLIFFMISTTFIESPGLEIDLPETSAVQLTKDPQEAQVYLAADGSIYYQQQPVDLTQLRVVLGALGPKATQMTFLLMADKSVPHGKVVQLMDIAKKAGFNKLAIATESETASETSH